MISTMRSARRSARSSWSGTTRVWMSSRSRGPSMGPRGTRPTRGVGEAFGGVTCRSFRRGRTSTPGTISPAAARGKTTCRLSLTVCAVCRICKARPLLPTDALVIAARVAARSRRSRERLTLELAGLCLGLLDRREPTAGHVPAARSDPLHDITTLPGIIAHELSNPLTAARAGLHLAMESLGRWTEVAAGRRLELLDELGQVVEDIDRSASFLRAVKDRARGALARSERFDAVRVVRSCCTLESRVLKEKKIPLEFDSTLEVVYLKGDPNALYDLLVNLIRNAADASAGRPAPIRVDLTQVGNALRLRVRDEGAGIRPQDLDRIFEPGFTTKPFGEGSGMGLVVVQSVVRNMFAGSVAVDSTVGSGTTVTVTLPIPAQRAVDSRSEAPAS